MFGSLRKAFLTTTVLFCTGCATSSVNMADWYAQQAQNQSSADDVIDSEQQDNGLRYRPERRDTVQQEMGPDGQVNQPEGIYLTPKPLYAPDYSHKTLRDYAEQLAMKLVDSGRHLTNQSRVGVASFVNLDSSLQNADMLGNQLAEMMMSEIQQYGVPVVDHKMTGLVQVKPHGDYVFSRKASRLPARVEMEYMLSGTLIQNEKGVMVNARIVSLHNNVSIASAAIQIPHFVVASLPPKFVMLN